MMVHYEEYVRLKKEMRNSRLYDAGRMTMLKSAFKCAYGFALYHYCKHFNRLAVFSDQVRYDWVQIAHNSDVFGDSVHSVDCIMQEMHALQGAKLNGYFERLFKKGLKTWQKDARRESETILEGYKKVAKHDIGHYNPRQEQMKIKKAVKFIYLGLMTYYICSLPTYLTIEEYSVLSIANAKNAKDRYHFVNELNCYKRIGKKRFKPAVVLFGASGARILFKKKIERFDRFFHGIYGD